MHNPGNIYLSKVNNRNTRNECETSWKLTIKTLTRRQWRSSGIFIVNLEHFSSVSIADFEQVNASREVSLLI